MPKKPKRQKPECMECFNEEGSLACVRPSHQASRVARTVEPISEKRARTAKTLSKLESRGLHGFYKAVLDLRGAGTLHRHRAAMVDELYR